MTSIVSSGKFRCLGLIRLIVRSPALQFDHASQYGCVLFPVRRHGRLFPCPFLPLMFPLLTSCATILPIISTACIFFSDTLAFLPLNFPPPLTPTTDLATHKLSPTHHHRCHQLCLRFQVIHRLQRPAVNRRAPWLRRRTTQAAAENPQVRARSGRPHFENKKAAVTRHSFNIASASIRPTHLRDEFCASFTSTGAIPRDGRCVYLTSYRRPSTFLSAIQLLVSGSSSAAAVQLGVSTSIKSGPSTPAHAAMPRPVLIRRLSQEISINWKEAWLGYRGLALERSLASAQPREC